MGLKNKGSSHKEKKRKIRSYLYKEPLIERFKDECDLSKEVIDAATLIFRLSVGLGKGLSSSQKRSYSAASVWYAVKLIEGEELSKEKLAEISDVSPRTLARRFSDLEGDEDSKKVMDYVKSRIKRWREKKEKRLQNLL
ncbi:hypothetical protein AKJ64_04780 [candidate division MSBL1 archaeon SCGC-AAA259E17]|uniref:Transcription factor TFIIB cyclin-like domain-containing protein n=1 Tax=candidate division MSBL1 archaeon SCGC-AAA259E17 TaxID=1698263 RepID=A0A133UB11_9EURY|nr:hypothetical protein AKJ64_04780 [candidate division MSBL1 archaeon SCGC-AAA259E17]